MKGRLSTAVFVGLALSSGCAPKGPDQGSSCREDPPSGLRCCDSGAYALVSVADLARDPAHYLGQRVETAGIAEWFPDAAGGSGCVCADNTCSCSVPLSLRSSACGTHVVLGGQYLGRPVECSAAGCYPLNVPSSNGVCGLWTMGQGAGTELSPVLNVEAYCVR